MRVEGAYQPTLGFYL